MKQKATFGKNLIFVFLKITVIFMGKSKTWLTFLLITSRFNVALIWNYMGQENIIFLLLRVPKDLTVTCPLPVGSNRGC